MCTAKPMRNPNRKKVEKLTIFETSRNLNTGKKKAAGRKKKDKDKNVTGAAVPSAAAAAAAAGWEQEEDFSTSSKVCGGAGYACFLLGSYVFSPLQRNTIEDKGCTGCLFPTA